MDSLLSSGVYFGFEVGYRQDNAFRLNITSYNPNEVIEEHSHKNPYLSILINGHYQELNANNATLVKPGEILYRPSGSAHANQFLKNGGRCMNIEWQHDLFAMHGLHDFLPEQPVKYEAGSFEYLNKILFCFANYGEPILSEEHIFLWLAKSINKIPQRLQWLPRLKAILENEPHLNHSLHSLSEQLRIHPVYLARAFKEKEGLTVGEYQLKIKVKCAVQLLFTTNKSINEIAYSAGFTDAAHFIKAFRFYYQVTPRKFRLALKN